LEAWKSRFARCKAWFDDMPDGLSSNNSPNRFLLDGRVLGTLKPD
jgi:hypothetical protein